jgi:MFS superfamily sulfate permease-like transporter
MLVLFALYTLSDYVEFDPKPSLAAIAFCGVYKLIQFDEMARMWRGKREILSRYISLFSMSTLYSSDTSTVHGMSCVVTYCTAL